MRRTNLGGRFLNRPVKKSLSESYLDKAEYYLNKANRLFEDVAPESDFRWKDDDPSTGVIIEYKGNASIVKVPEGVVELGCRDHAGNYDSDGVNGCFDGCDGITQINLPKSLKKIGSHAFADCRNLKSIVIPNSVTEIGELAFFACFNLESIDIPNGVKSIGVYAFKDCFIGSITCSADLDLSGTDYPDGCEIIRR